MRARVLDIPSASGVIFNRGGCVLIHASHETAGAAAEYKLWDGTSTGGGLLLPVSLSASESTRDFFPKHFMPFETGLYFELVSGAIEGVIYVLDDHRCEDHWEIDIHV